MRTFPRSYTCVLTLLVLAAVARQATAGPGEGPAPAPEPAQITKVRPFVAGIPDWERGRTLALAVLKDDEDAVKEIAATGLSYFPQLRRHAGPHPVTKETLRKHLDWIEAMQTWELNLIQLKPAELVPKFEALKPRFVQPDAQAARVVLHAHYWGDTTTRDALAKKYAALPWIKATLAWIGLTPDPKVAVRDLMAVAGEAEALGRYSFTFARVHVEDPPADLPDVGVEAWKWEVEDVTTHKGIHELLLMPLEFYDQSLYERLGAICAESGNAKLITDTESALKQRAKDLKLHEDYLAAFSVAVRFASEEVAKTSYTTLVSCALDSTGPAILGFAVHGLGETVWFERCAAAIAAWANMPDFSLTRRFLLSRLLELDDAMLASLAVRAVLALQDDDRASYNDVARALLRFGSHKETAAALAKAMNETGHAELKKIAGALTKGDATPLDAVVKGPLNLKLEQKVAVLNVFAHDDERAAYGGATGVYWMNRATFLEGTRNLRGAMDALWQGLDAASAKAPTGPNAAIERWHLFRERNLTQVVAAEDLAAGTKSRPKTANQAKVYLAESGDITKPPAANAFCRAYAERFSGRHMPDDVYKELAGQPARWGGAGLALCAERDLLQRNFTQRRQHWERAVRTSPVDPFMHMIFGPDAENYGTFSGANWDTACRHSLAHALLMPFSIDTTGLLITTHVRYGTVPASATSLARGSLRRAPECVWGCQNFRLCTQFNINGHVVAAATLRMALASPERVAGPYRAFVQANLMSLRGGTPDEPKLRYCCNLNGMSGNFARVAFAQVAQDRDPQDVSSLLDLSFSISQIMPDVAIDYVARADKIGVSEYGRFVGTQALVLAHAQKGTLDQVLDRYHEMRGGDAGNPPHLDVFLLAGLFRGGNVAQAEKARDAINQYSLDMKLPAMLFQWRRLHMALGEHTMVGAIPVPSASPVFLEDAPQYSGLFHEARAMLDAEDFDGLLARAEPILDVECESGMGVYLDAAMLRAVALKASGKPVAETPEPGKPRRLNVVPQSLADLFLDTSYSIDGAVFEMLCGRAEPGKLPQRTWRRIWHGEKYGERTSVHLGSGLLTYQEALAREHFVSGVLAWLNDEVPRAQADLQKCVQLNQRFSHEYHVAEWLLANPLKPQEGK